MLRAQLDVGDQVVPVRVAQIFPMADAQRHTVTIKFDLPQGVSAPGMYAKVLVPDFDAPAVLPSHSYQCYPFQWQPARGVCPAPDGKPELRLVRVGEKLSGGYTSVVSGHRKGSGSCAIPMRITSGWATPSQGTTLIDGYRRVYPGSFAMAWPGVLARFDF